MNHSESRKILVENLFRNLRCANFDAVQVEAQKVSRIVCEQGLHPRSPRASGNHPIIGSTTCYVVVGCLSEQRTKGFVVQARECSFGEKAGIDESDRVLRRQSMRRRESGEHCVRLNQGAAMTKDSRSASRRSISVMALSWCSCQVHTVAIMTLVSGRKLPI